MNNKLKRRITVSIAVAFAITVMLSPRVTENSFLFPELTAFPSIAFDTHKDEDESKNEVHCKFFIFELIREIFWTD